MLGEFQAVLTSDYHELIREAQQFEREGKVVLAEQARKQARNVWICLSAEARREAQCSQS
jgi:predicted RNA-binding protein YlxR (DUF448 family)